MVPALSKIYLLRAEELHQEELVQAEQEAKEKNCLCVFTAFYEVLITGTLRDITNVWCRRPDLNRHEQAHYPLKIACLPIPPLRQLEKTQSRFAYAY